jgi:hypothetical protein
MPSDGCRRGLRRRCHRSRIWETTPWSFHPTGMEVLRKCSLLLNHREVSVAHACPSTSGIPNECAEQRKAALRRVRRAVTARVWVARAGRQESSSRIADCSTQEAYEKSAQAKTPAASGCSKTMEAGTDFTTRYEQARNRGDEE